MTEPPATAATGLGSMVPAPDKFTFTSPQEWPKWKRRFERYRTVSGLEIKPQADQVSSLIYFMGDEADDILASLRLSSAEESDFQKVLLEFDRYFIGKRNIIYERARFNQRIQLEGESVNDFITALHIMSQYCQFGTLNEELIRDRIVVGIKDKTLSERMQLDPDLTLDKATTLARQSETVKGQQEALQVKNTEAKVYNIRKKEVAQRPPNKSRQDTSVKNKFNQHGFKPSSLINKLCDRCGKDTHTRDTCPAVNAICNKCKKKGHYARMCRSVQKVTEITSENVFLGEISVDDKEMWKVPIVVSNQSVIFKVDTGADVTVVPESLYQKRFTSLVLERSDKRLFGPGRQLLDTVGMFSACLAYREQEILATVYVVKHLEMPLLARSVSVKLNIIKRIDELSTTDTETLNVKQEFPELFQGLGHVKTGYSIKLKPNAKPFALSVPRRVPLPLMKKVKLKLDEMVLMGVIEPVEEPTDWCSAMVIVTKPNGDFRICVDLTELNKYVEREIHPMPVSEHILGQLGNAKFYSKLDANSGFWQFELAEESQKLTTFMSPFGRYFFKRLPFGISSAPEFFQKRMTQLLGDLEGFVCNMDDILVFGNTKEEHDERLRKVLQRLREKGHTLNPEKCEFGVTRIKFLGHEIDKNGIQPDRDKVTAVREMKEPTSVTEVKSFLGMVNYLGKFIPHLADISRPLNSLLSSKNEWIWDTEQQKSFDRLKEALTCDPVLALFDPTKPTILSTDASSYGLGAVLRQQQENGQYRPVAYASKTLSQCEQRYAQIEKEGLAIVWACERFRDFILGMKIRIETDHKPLVPIFTTKPLDDITPRLQRMRLRLMRYSYDMFHTPGKEIVAADFFSRNPLPEVGIKEFEEEVTAYVQAVTDSVPASDMRIEEIKMKQATDPTCILLRQYSSTGWPVRKEVDQSCQDYWQHRGDIGDQHGLLMRGTRLIIPQSLRKEILSCVHQGHLGITKCRARARQSIWWPGLSKEIEAMIQRCPQCIKESTNRHEPLMSTPFPERPWQTVAMDLFYLNGIWYLLITDFYSRYPEVIGLQKLTTSAVINHIKCIFARHGTPEVVRSDNGPQFEPVLTSEFSKFAKEWGFTHVTSSPRFPQSNGFVEAAVKIIKKTLKKEEDGNKALQSYRATPLANGFSPAELLMGRRLRTSVPMTASLLNPKVPSNQVVLAAEAKRIQRQRDDYNRHHGVRNLVPMEPGTPVWITDKRKSGQIQSRAETPRSYWVKTDSGLIRRNRFHLRPGSNQGTGDIPADEHGTMQEGHLEPDETERPEKDTKVSSETPRRSRFGREIKPVRRLDL